MQWMFDTAMWVISDITRVGECKWLRNRPADSLLSYPCVSSTSFALVSDRRVDRTRLSGKFRRGYKQMVDLRSQ